MRYTFTRGKGIQKEINCKTFTHWVKKDLTEAICLLWQVLTLMCQLATLEWAAARSASCSANTSASATNLWASSPARGEALSFSHFVSAALMCSGPSMCRHKARGQLADQLG